VLSVARGKQAASEKNGSRLGFKETLWQAADKQRGHMDAAEYKHVVPAIPNSKF
jgi:type I restriction enzyme M protein